MRTKPMVTTSTTNVLPHHSHAQRTATRSATLNVLPHDATPLSHSRGGQGAGQQGVAAQNEHLNITSFTGHHRWLSNFWPAPVVLDNVLYPTVENAYQAAKTDPANRTPFVACTPGQAKRLGRAVKLRHDWATAKLHIMRELIAQKFARHSGLAEKLAATSGELVEGNTWGDTFWGVCRGHGQNQLGKLLMEHRATLQRSLPC